MRAPIQKQGGALILVFVVLMAVTIVSTGIFTLVNHSAVEVVRDTQAEQAFWAAESGLQQVLEKIYTDSDYRDAVSLEKDYPGDPDRGGFYAMQVGPGGQTGHYTVELYREGRDYNVAVQSTVGEMKRRLEVLAENVRPDIANGILILDGDAEIKQDAKIFGDIVAWRNLKLGADVAVSGAIQAGFLGGFDYPYTELTEAPDVKIDAHAFDAELRKAAAAKTPEKKKKKGKGRDRKEEDSSKGSGWERDRKGRTWDSYGWNTSRDYESRSGQSDARNFRDRGVSRNQRFARNYGRTAKPLETPKVQRVTKEETQRKRDSGEKTSPQNKDRDRDDNQEQYRSHKDQDREKIRERDDDDERGKGRDRDDGDHDTGRDRDDNKDKDPSSKGGYSGNIDLNDYDENELYINGNVTVPDFITGPGRLVIQGNLALAKDYSIDDDVQIILSGNMKAAKDGSLGTNVNIFAKGDISLNKATAGYIGQSSIVAIGRLSLKKEFRFSGLLYGGGRVSFQKEPQLIGALICGNGLSLAKDAVIHYDASVIPEWIYENLLMVRRYTSDNVWNELPPH